MYRHGAGGGRFCLDKCVQNSGVTCIRVLSSPFFDGILIPKPSTAFGGWASFVLKRPWLKPYVSHLFHPFRWYQGINDKWEAENHARMMGEEHECVIPSSAHICLMHGRNDPVLHMPYLRKFAGHLRARTRATVSEVVFPRARHSMAIVEYPEAYKSAHIEHFLANVPEFQARHHVQKNK